MQGINLPRPLLHRLNPAHFMLNQFPDMSAFEVFLDDFIPRGETRTEIVMSTLIFRRGTRRPLS